MLINGPRAILTRTSTSKSIVEFLLGRVSVEVVQYLIDTGADVNHREVFFNTSAFDLAVWRQKIDARRVLLAAGSDQREDALGLAVECNAPDLARAAIEAGPSVRDR